MPSLLDAAVLILEGIGMGSWCGDGFGGMGGGGDVKVFHLARDSSAFLLYSVVRMQTDTIIQGRRLSAADLAQI